MTFGLTPTWGCGRSAGWLGACAIARWRVADKLRDQCVPRRLGWRDGSVGFQPAHQGALGVCDPVADDPDSVVDPYQRFAERAMLPTPASETWFKAPACRSESA